LFHMYFFGLFRNKPVCFGCFETGPKHRNKPKKIVIGFAKQTENEPKQIEFRYVSVRTEKKFVCFEDTLVVHDKNLKAINKGQTIIIF
jgi:hypothetical protein